MEQIFIAYIIIGVGGMCFFVHGDVHGEQSVRRRMERQSPTVLNNNESDAVAFLERFNEMAQDVFYRRSIASWNYQTNITDENQRKHVSKLNRSKKVETFFTDKFHIYLRPACMIY